MINLSRIIGVIGCVFLVALSVPALAQEFLRSEPRYSALDLEAGKGGSEAVLNIIEREAGDYKARSIIMQWLRDRVWVKFDPDPFYSFYYSDLLFTTANAFDRAGKPEVGNDLYQTAFYSLNVFELMALTDAVRCNDPSVDQAVKTLINGRYAHFQNIINRLTVDAKQKARNLALSYEERLANRLPFAPICSSGMKAMQAALNDPRHSERTVDAPGTLGGKKTIVETVSPYSPDFLPDAVWNERRQEIRKMLQGSP